MPSLKSVLVHRQTASLEEQLGTLVNMLLMQNCCNKSAHVRWKRSIETNTARWQSIDRGQILRDSNTGEQRGSYYEGLHPEERLQR